MAAFRRVGRRRRLCRLNINTNRGRFRASFQFSRVRVIAFRLSVGNGRTRMLVVVMSFAVKHGVVGSLFLPSYFRPEKLVLDFLPPSKRQSVGSLVLSPTSETNLADDEVDRERTPLFHPLWPTLYPLPRKESLTHNTLNYYYVLF